MNKAIYDRAVPTRNLITTITGAVTLIVTILVGFGVIKAELQADVLNYANLIITSVVAVWGAIQGLISIFKSKDA